MVACRHGNLATVEFLLESAVYMVKFPCTAGQGVNTNRWVYTLSRVNEIHLTEKAHTLEHQIYFLLLFWNFFMSKIQIWSGF